jgi:hypothetical protein
LASIRRQLTCVLIDDGVQHATDQKATRHPHQFMADECDFPAPARFFYGFADAACPGADIVNAEKIVMLLQNLPRRGIGLSVVVMTLAQPDNFKLWKFLSKYVLKAHFALFMAAIAEATRDHRRLTVALTDKSSQQIARRASGGPIVDADIAQAL